ncbi:ovarian cancer G-protein coupled receptor 1-like [Anabas testudineus]|uniref:ovarian cancer G-protein coupled receptor 1-like n=1 Tax=Anabas testudineus TaxID=64144 RepID=UPI000E45B5EF|nr:ovarian cancer G-protein coupled receptor 1-like [Anabas testudineus]
MEDFFNTTEQDNNTTSEDVDQSVRVLYVLQCVIISIGLPLTLMSIYAVYSLVRASHVAPIYIINLLISHLIQLCCMIVDLTEPSKKTNEILFYIYYLGLLANVGFMVCIAMERYFVIAWPVWYRFRRTIRNSLMVCVVVWSLPLIYLLPYYFDVDFQVREVIYAVFLLFPCPLLIFFLGGTLKALSKASSVPSDEKRRIVALLTLVLLTYILLFLPSAVWSLEEKARASITFSHLSYTVVLFSPLADSCLYVLLRKGFADRVLAFVCCRMESSTIYRSTELIGS